MSLSGSAHAQETAIGYQGSLNEGGAPGRVVLATVPATNGRFSVSLDFGPDIFTGAAVGKRATVTLRCRPF